MDYADEKKKILLEWLLPRLRSNEIVLMELAFRDATRRADIVILGPRRLAAIEVKSERDSTRRLAAQVIAYQSMFLESWVAATPKHLASIRAMVPRAIGLIELPKQGKPLVVRKASVKATLSKDAAAKWLRVRDLLRIVDRKPKRSDIEYLRRDVTTHLTKQEMTGAVLNTLHQRHLRTFQRFLDERGKALTLDDVQILALQRTIARTN